VYIAKDATCLIQLNCSELLDTYEILSIFNQHTFATKVVSDIAIFVLKRDVKLQLTNFARKDLI